MIKRQTIKKASNGISLKFVQSLVNITGAAPGFGQAGAQLLRQKVANVAKWSHASKVSNL